MKDIEGNVTYFGSWENDKMNGFGTKLESYNIYEGYFLNNKKYWEAILKTKNG